MANEIGPNVKILDTLFNDDFADAVVTFPDSAAGVATSAGTVQINDREGTAVGKVVEALLIASDSIYAGGLDLNGNVSFGTATTGSILDNGTGWAVIKTDATGAFACTATNGVDEEVFMSVRSADGGQDALTAGIKILGCVPDSVTWVVP